MVRQSRSSAILIHSPILLHVLQTKLKFTRLALALWQFRTIVCEKKYKTTLLQKYLQLIKNWQFTRFVIQRYVTEVLVLMLSFRLSTLTTLTTLLTVVRDRCAFDCSVWFYSVFIYHSVLWHHFIINKITKCGSTKTLVVIILYWKYNKFNLHLLYERWYNWRFLNHPHILLATFLLFHSPLAHGSQFHIWSWIHASNIIYNDQSTNTHYCALIKNNALQELQTYWKILFNKLGMKKHLPCVDTRTSCNKSLVEGQNANQVNCQSTHRSSIGFEWYWYPVSINTYGIKRGIEYHLVHKLMTCGMFVAYVRNKPTTRQTGSHLLSASQYLRLRRAPSTYRSS